MRRLILSIIVSLAAFVPALCATPEGRLFCFERSTNRNYICYDVNLRDDGHLDTDNPIHVYWIRVEEGGGRKELTFIQRKLAFGYKVVTRKTDEVTIHLTAYNKLLIRICRHQGRWLARATIGGHEAQLDKLFAQMRSPNSLHCEYVDLFGRDLTTQEAVTERIRK
ncbi:MAG: DUF4833 domain-containing protein [Bacteroidaceae bacterium]|nr:DUF4833 domain-containing protein [Bacteroidaceae bacterium]